MIHPSEWRRIGKGKKAHLFLDGKEVFAICGIGGKTTPWDLPEEQDQCKVCQDLKKALPEPPMKTFCADCAECGKRNQSERMILCPKCDKWFCVPCYITVNHTKRCYEY